MNDNILAAIALQLEKRVAFENGEDYEKDPRGDVAKLTPMQRIANVLVRWSGITPTPYMSDIEKIYAALCALYPTEVPDEPPMIIQ